MLHLHSPMQWKVVLTGQDAFEERFFRGYNVIILGLGVLDSLANDRNLAYRNPEDNFILKEKWDRIIVDESHHIKNSNTKRFPFMMQLQSERRWCMTGKSMISVG